MERKTELKILGRIVVVTALAEHVCGHNPDEDDFTKRLNENTVTVVIGGVEWLLSARTSHLGPYVLNVRMLSKGTPFKGKNYGIDLALNPWDVVDVDKMIINSFDADKTVQNEFKKYVDELTIKPLL